ncbi:MAG: DUF2304 domain-containing protein [Candidatus Tectomicrobia bacterium]|uniref:DUF2304 domain-containing protein n=1 Tax=Tectimicrobiota bacterium TaxID=2528274 RepID=A0A932CRF2_UNCTE|nr:DUF2304 domain-containing protein [Candidatus Tectomicrobia bacterium]
MERIQILSIAMSLVVLYVILSFVRKEHLRVEYSILWVAAAVGMLLFAASPRLLGGLSGLVGIYYPPSTLFLIFSVFYLVMLFHLSIIISRSKESNKRLAQMVGLLQWRIERLEKELGGPHG